MKENKLSDAQIRAIRKWDAKNLETKSFRFEKGYGNKIKTYADRAGLSQVEFVRRAIEEKAKRENLD